MAKDYLRLNSLHRRPKPKPKEPEPIVFSDEYKEFVYKILQEKRKREVIADILNERQNRNKESPASAA